MQDRPITLTERIKHLADPTASSAEIAGAATIGFATIYAASLVVDPNYLALLLTVGSAGIFTMQYGPTRTAQEAAALGNQLLQSGISQGNRAIRFFKEKYTGVAAENQPQDEINPESPKQKLQ